MDWERRGAQSVLASDDKAAASNRLPRLTGLACQVSSGRVVDHPCTWLFRGHYAEYPRSMVAVDLR